MNCPKCNNEKTTVTNTRYRTKSKLRRLRTCPKCKHQFATIEMLEDASELNKLIRDLKITASHVKYTIDVLEGLDV